MLLRVFKLRALVGAAVGAGGPLNERAVTSGRLLRFSVRRKRFRRIFTSKEVAEPTGKR